MVRVEVKLLPVGRRPIYVRCAYFTADRVLTQCRKLGVVPYGKMVFRNTDGSNGVVLSNEGNALGTYSKMEAE